MNAKKKYRCIKREPGIDFTIDKVYETDSYGYINGDSGESMYPSVHKDLFKEVK